MSIKLGSKVRLKGKPLKGVSFRVLSVDRWENVQIKHSLSGVIYEVSMVDLELIK